MYKNKNHITCHHWSLTLTLFINTSLVINNKIQPKTWPFQELEFNKIMESKTWSQVLSLKTCNNGISRVLVAICFPCHVAMDPSRPQRAPPGFVKKSQYHKKRETCRHYFSGCHFVLSEQISTKFGVQIASNNQSTLCLLRTKRGLSKDELQVHGQHPACMMHG